MGKQLILLEVGILVEVDKSEDCYEMIMEGSRIGNRLQEAVNKTLGCAKGDMMGSQSLSVTVLDSNHVNCGQCANCGALTTDLDAPDPITLLGSRGGIHEGRLLCDDCLPSDHRHAF